VINYRLQKSYVSKKDYKLFITPCIEYKRESIGVVVWRSISIHFLNYTLKIELRRDEWD